MNIRSLIISLFALTLTGCMTAYRSTMDFIVAADSSARIRVIDATKILTTRFELQPDTAASVPPFIYGYSRQSDHYYVLLLRDSSGGKFLVISFQHFAFARSGSARDYKPEDSFADTIRTIFGSRVLHFNTIRNP
jgi:hypothetical protein